MVGQMSATNLPIRSGIICNANANQTFEHRTGDYSKMNDDKAISDLKTTALNSNECKGRERDVSP